MIDAGYARRAAADALAAARRDQDPALRPWGRVSVGVPFVVQDVAGSPSYWLVPLVAKQRAIGFVRVDGGGRVIAVGVTCRTPERVAECARHVTGITADEAIAKAQSEVELAAGETLTRPRYVHDGPPGREAWLIETVLGSRPHRWLFASSGGCYERPAGVVLAGSPGRE
jgi:hypothetical protein